MTKRKSRPQPQPTKAVFVQYAELMGIDPKLAGDQWEIWDIGEWCDSENTPILNWKNKLGTFARCKYGAFNERFGRRTRAQRDRVAEANARSQEIVRQRREDEQKREKRQ